MCPGPRYLSPTFPSSPVSCHVSESAVTTATALDELCINTIRTLSMEAVQKAESGHPGTPMALAPLAYVTPGHDHPIH